MSKQITLKAETREVEGRKVKKLRQAGILPSNVFGRDIKSTSIQVNLSDFQKTFGVAGETNIVEIEIGKDRRPVLIHNIQRDPVSGNMVHVDFLQVDLNKKVTAEVPVELTGISPAEKQSLGTVVQYINEIEVEALPAELPDKFEIDVSILSEVDQMIQVKDLKIDIDKVKIEADPELIVVKVEPPKVEKEVPVVSVAPVEGEVAAAGETPSEGDTVSDGDKTKK